MACKNFCWFAACRIMPKVKETASASTRVIWSDNHATLYPILNSTYRSSVVAATKQRRANDHAAVSRNRDLVNRSRPVRVLSRSSFDRKMRTAPLDAVRPNAFVQHDIREGAIAFSKLAD